MNLGLNLQRFSCTLAVISQNEDFLTNLSQENYNLLINPIKLLSNKKNPSDQLTKEENTLHRKTVGQLNCLAETSRPNISFHGYEASSNLNKATVADVIKINKTIKYVKSSSISIEIPPFNFNHPQLLIFTDASFNNLSNGGSQGGQITFFVDNFNNCCPIYWNLS